MTSPKPDPIRNLPLVRPTRPGEKRAAGWQITVTAVGAIVIVTLFLWGINNQRDETGGQQTAATQPTPVTPQGEQQSQGSGGAPTTTGQGDNSQRDSPKSRFRDGQQSNQPSANPPPNGQPTKNSNEPAQPRGQ